MVSINKGIIAQGKKNLAAGWPVPNYCGGWATAAASLQLSRRAPAQHSPLGVILSNRAPGKVRGVPAAKISGWGDAGVEVGDGRATSVSPAGGGAGGDGRDVPPCPGMCSQRSKEMPCFFLCPKPGGARGVLVTPKGCIGCCVVISSNLISWGEAQNSQSSQNVGVALAMLG